MNAAVLLMNDIQLAMKALMWLKLRTVSQHRSSVFAAAIYFNYKRTRCATSYLKRALVAQNIEQPEIAKELSPTNVTLRGPSGGQPFKLLTPGRTVIVSDRPSFTWEKLSGATGYRVLVGDLTGHEVAKSEELSSERTSWTPPRPLKRGETYAWNVIAIVDGKELYSPGPSASTMKFQVLSTTQLKRLTELEKTGSHLALGVFYVRQGMVGEAEHEFQILAKENPRSPVAKKLLKQIQSWQIR